MSNSFRRIFTLTARNIKEIIRDPLSLIFNICLPLFMEILFYFMFHNLTDQFEMKYLAPGIVVFSQAFISLFTGLIISVDRNSCFLTRLYVSPAKSYEFIFSYALAVIPLALIQAILFFVVGGIFDNSLFGMGMLFGIILSIVTSLFFIACGILIGSLCKDKTVGGVASIIISGQSLLSGMWFPTQGLSDGILNIMKILPFKNAITIIQNMILGVNNLWYDFTLPLLIVLLYTILMFILAIVSFNNKMKEK